MIKTITKPYQCGIQSNGMPKWAVTVRLGSQVETFKRDDEKSALAVVASFAKQGYQLI